MWVIAMVFLIHLRFSHTIADAAADLPQIWIGRSFLDLNHGRDRFPVAVLHAAGPRDKTVGEAVQHVVHIGEVVGETLEECRALGLDLILKVSDLILQG